MVNHIGLSEFVREFEMNLIGMIKAYSINMDK